MKPAFIFISFTFTFFTAFTFGQNQISDTANIMNKMNPQLFKPSKNEKSFILPGTLIVTGSCLFESKINTKFHEFIAPDDRSRKFHADDYLQYTPAGLAIGFEFAGLKGKHPPLKTAVIYAISNVILNAIVIPAKHFSHEMRPDSSGYSSFPSGHTSEAFASAELMRMEFRETHPWLGVAGYLMAGATGYLRMYNNKHWISDVITGAGIGIASTRLSYLIYDRFCNKSKSDNNKKLRTFLLPRYQNRQPGFCLVSKFR